MLDPDWTHYLPEGPVRSAQCSRAKPNVVQIIAAVKVGRTQGFPGGKACSMFLKIQLE